MSQNIFKRLHKQISERMELEEIRRLCLFLDIDYENIAGNTKDSQITGLLLYIQKHQQIPNLLENLKDMRPDIFTDEEISLISLNTPQSKLADDSNYADLQSVSSELPENYVARNLIETTSNHSILVDKALFIKIRDLIPPNSNTIYYLRGHHFGGMFEHKLNKPLNDFYYHCKNLDFEFLDGDLEGAKIKFRDALNEFLDMLGRETFPPSEEDGIIESKHLTHRLVPKPQNGNWVRYREVVERLNELADNAHLAYQDFIRLGQRKLVV